MKATTYIFGNFSNGYSQYPDDYTRDLFGSLGKSRKGATELIYHRDGSLTYYIYMREISRTEKTFIGLCYVFNDILITDFSYLFNIFEDAITNIVITGELLEFTNDGTLTTKVSQLYTNTDELQRISDYLNSKLSSLGRYAEKLPPRNFAISSSEWRTYTFDDVGEVESSVKNYFNIRVIKGENYETGSLRSYAGKLRTQNEKIKTLTNEIFKLKAEISKLKRQKKQFAVVVILIVIIAIGLLVFVAKINDKNEIIQRKNNKIEALEEYRDRLKADSVNLTYELSSTKDTLKLTKKTLERLRADYSNLETKKNELYTECENQKRTISSLKKDIAKLENDTAVLKAKIRNNSTSHSNASYSTGASRNKSNLNRPDNNYAMWLHATNLLKINNFSVYPSKSGYITIGLYKSSGYLVATCRSYVYKNQWNMISPSGFDLNPNTDYYMAIKDANGIELTWHETSSNEYSKYQTGPLRIKGYSKKGEKSIGTKYYQYFYEINYTTR